MHPNRYWRQRGSLKSSKTPSSGFLRCKMFCEVEVVTIPKGDGDPAEAPRHGHRSRRPYAARCSHRRGCAKNSVVVGAASTNDAGASRQLVYHGVLMTTARHLIGHREAGEPHLTQGESIICHF